MKLYDIFLLPKELYRKLDNGLPALYIGILLVGIRNIGLYLWSNQEKFAPAKLLDILAGNALIILGFVVLFGIIDVVFFSYPFHDLFKFLKSREENAVHQASVIKIMKVYILANLVVTPADCLLTAAYFSVDPNTVNAGLALIMAIAGLLNYIWYFGVIARGSATLFDFKGPQVIMVFVIAFFYNGLLNQAYSYIYEKGLMTLLLR